MKRSILVFYKAHYLPRRTSHRPQYLSPRSRHRAHHTICFSAWFFQSQHLLPCPFPSVPSAQQSPSFLRVFAWGSLSAWHTVPGGLWVDGSHHLKLFLSLNRYLQLRESLFFKSNVDTERRREGRKERRKRKRTRTYLEWATDGGEGWKKSSRFWR